MRKPDTWRYFSGQSPKAAARTRPDDCLAGRRSRPPAGVFGSLPLPRPWPSWRSSSLPGIRPLYSWVRPRCRLASVCPHSGGERPRRLAIGLLLLVLAPVAAIPEGDRPMAPSAEERAWLERTLFRRARVEGWAPFGVSAGREAAAGIGEGYWQQLRDWIGLRERLVADLVPAAWPQALQQRRIDLYPAAIPSPALATEAVFSVAYGHYPLAIVSLRERGSVAGLAALRGQPVAVVEAHGTAAWLRAHHPEVDWRPVRDLRAGLEAVAASRMRALVDLLPVLQPRIQAFDRLHLAGVGETLVPLCVAVHRDQSRLLPLLNRAIAALDPEDHAAVWRSSTARGLAAEFHPPWGVLGAALVLIAVIVHRNRRLAGEVVRRLQAETQVREISARLEKIADRLPGLIFQLRQEADGRLVLPYVSQRLRQIFGLSSEAVRADSNALFARIHPQDRAAVEASLRESARTLRPWRLEYRVCPGDGGVRWVLGDAIPESLREGRILWHGYITDISERKQADAALRESELRFRQFADNTDAVFWVQESNRILYVNAAYETLWGRRRESLYAQPDSFLEAIHPEDQGRVREAMEAARGDEVVPSSLLYRLVRPDGEIRWIHARSHPVSGTPGRLIGIANDVTERKRAERERQASQERFARIAATIPGALYEYVQEPDGRDRFLYLGPHCRELFEREAEDLTADSGRFWDLVEARERDALLAADRLAPRQGENFYRELQIVTPSGRRKWIALNARLNPAEPGQPRVWSGHILDISGQKATEAELIEASEAADAASRAKSGFLASMSHELRTPLNGILGYAHILQQQFPRASKPWQHARTIERSGRHLLALINEILDLAKIEAGKVELVPGPVRLDELLHDALAMIRVRAEERNLSLVSAFGVLPEVVETDAQRLQQVLLNLLGNAVKFTPRGRLTLAVQPLSREAREVVLRFAVGDTGCGIPGDKIHEVFQRFEQVSEPSPHIEGTGLGLAICRNLVTLLGGHLELMSRRPGGAWHATASGYPKPDQLQGTILWFDLRLPVLEESGPLQDERRVVGCLGQAPSILVADATADSRRLFRDLLEPLGCTVWEADSAEAGLGMARERHPDVLITGLRLLDMAGCQFVQQARRDPELAGLKIICHSASVAPGDRALSLRSGGDAFLPKPLHPGKLLALLGELTQVEWRYEELPRLESVEPPPPAALIEALQRAAAAGEVDELLTLVEPLGQATPRFAGQVRRLAENLRLEELSVYLRERHASQITREARHD